ncbi:MAG: hypothetical protein ABIH34_00090 [Nanoarchaeota archaeon]
MGFFLFDLLGKLFGLIFPKNALQREVKGDRHDLDQMKNIEKDKEKALHNEQKAAIDLRGKARRLEAYLRKVPQEDFDIKNIETMIGKLKEAEMEQKTKVLGMRIKSIYYDHWTPVIRHLLPLAKNNRKLKKYLEDINNDFKRIMKNLNIIHEDAMKLTDLAAKQYEEEKKEAA